MSLTIGRDRVLGLPGVSLVLGILALGSVALTCHPASLAYLDYVDGYYLYTANRLAHGAMLYRQVMGVQPPGIYLVGDLLFRLQDTLAIARWYAAAVHVLILGLVACAAWRVTGNRLTAVLAALLFSGAPYSLVWGRLFDPNPLVTAVSMASLLALLSATRRGAAMAGFLGALALLVKIWYGPVNVALFLCLSRRRRDLLVPYVVAEAAALIGAVVVASLTAGGAFWQGLLVQDASGLSIDWLLAAVYDVVQRDGLLLLLALAGVWRLWPAVRMHSAATNAYQVAVLLSYLAGTVAVLAATTKVGTFSPIFQFAEPPLAVVAGIFLSFAWSAFRAGPAKRPQAADPAGRRFIAAIIFAVLFGSWVVPSLQALGASQSDASVRTVVRAIDHRTAPGSFVLGPPWYLYLSGRQGVDRYADINLWALEDARGDAAALARTAAVVRALQQQRVPLVLLDGRVARLPGVQRALQRRYRPLPFRDPLPPDRAVTLWVPASG